MNEFELAGQATRLLLLFTQALITQLALTAVCYRYHTVDERLCKQLLLVLDRTSDAEIVVTHERLSRMLGVRREGVTEVVSLLQRERIASRERGHITVLDRARLEQRECECYAVIKREYDRLLSGACSAP